MKRLYQYAVLRVVPSPERGERVNAGVALYCPEMKFLAARVHLDGARLRALVPKTNAADTDADIACIRRHLEAAVRVCEGDSGAGALGALSQRERFGRVVAPRSTVIQPSLVHTGFTKDPEKELSLLIKRLVE